MQSASTNFNESKFNFLRLLPEDTATGNSTLISSEPANAKRDVTPERGRQSDGKGKMARMLNESSFNFIPLLPLDTTAENSTLTPSPTDVAKQDDILKPEHSRQTHGKGNMARMLALSGAAAQGQEASEANSSLSNALQRIGRPLATYATPSKVTIVEVGPRDGLQNEKQAIDLKVKVELIDMLTSAGFAKIEAASFVSPKWVPQMAGSHEVMQQINRKDGVMYSALTPNMRGFDAAVLAKADEVVIFGSASESFSKNNINCSITESFDRFRPISEAAKANGVKLRGSISCSFDCPTEGKTPVESLVRLVQGMRDIGCDEIDIADTTGKGTPDQVREVMLRASQEFPAEKLAGHFHDTYGNALDNIKASLEVGIAIFHSSVAGLGGCPYAKGATGNVATEDVLALMEKEEIETGVSMDKVVDAGQFISGHLGRKYVTPAGNAVLAARDAAMRRTLMPESPVPQEARPTSDITMLLSATLSVDGTARLTPLPEHDD